MRVHRGMDKYFRLSRLFGLEPEGTALRIGVSDTNGPARFIALVVAGKVAVTIDEIAAGIAQLLQRPEYFGTCRSPVGGGDHAFEAQMTQEGAGFRVKPFLQLKEETRRILIATGSLIEHVPQRPESH